MFDDKILKNSKTSAEDISANRSCLNALPQSLYMDISNRCNIKCIICPYHWTDKDMTKGPLMPKELFFRVGRDLFPTARVVYLFGGGEVFLHPDWDEMFEFAGNWSFLPVISTNGMLLNDRRSQKLVEAGTHLRISFDGAIKKTFNRIRQGADFDMVLNKISRLTKFRKSHIASNRFCLRFSVTSFDENIKEAVKIVELASDLGIDEVIFHHLMVDRNPLAGKELSNFPELSDEMFTRALERGIELGIHVNVPSPFNRDREFGSRVEELRKRVPPSSVRDYFDYPTAPSNFYTCRVPWVETWIKTNGLVQPCCLISKEYSLGDTTLQSIKEIWNGKKYLKFREKINTDSPPPPCIPEACVHRIHQKNEGRLSQKKKRFSRKKKVILTSSCPGILKVEFKTIDGRFRGNTLKARIKAVNKGDTIWLCDKPDTHYLGIVRLGIKTMGRSSNEIGDFARIPLKKTVHPGSSVVIDFEKELPPDTEGFIIDLVAEGISWFEETGNVPVVFKRNR